MVTCIRFLNKPSNLCVILSSLLKFDTEGPRFEGKGPSLKPRVLNPQSNTGYCGFMSRWKELLSIMFAKHKAAA